MVASVNRMIRLIAEEKTDNSGFYSTLTGAEAVDDHTVRITTTEPDGVLPARMYWLKIVAPGTEDSDDLSDAPNGTGPYKFVGRETGVSTRPGRQPRLLGRRALDLQGPLRVRERGRHQARRAQVRPLRPHHQPGPAGRRPGAGLAGEVQGQEHPVLLLDADEGITADPNVRLALNLAVDKHVLADADLRWLCQRSTRASCSARRSSASTTRSTAYPYDPEKAKQLIEDAGVAGQTINLVGESSGRWLNDRDLARGHRRLLDGGRARCEARHPEFGAYLDILFDRDNREDAIFVSSSNDILDPDRQLCTYYQAGGIGSSNSNPICRR